MHLSVSSPTPDLMGSPYPSEDLTSIAGDFDDGGLLNKTMADHAGANPP